MNAFEKYQIESAVKAFRTDYSIEKAETQPHRSVSRQWDRIIRFVCGGCGGTLGRYEVNKHLAFCFHCRRFLFPETVDW